MTKPSVYAEYSVYCADNTLAAVPTHRAVAQPLQQRLTAVSRLSIGALIAGAVLLGGCSRKEEVASYAPKPVAEAARDVSNLEKRKVMNSSALMARSAGGPREEVAALVAAAPPAAPAPVSIASPGSSGDAAAPQRFLAVRHDFQIATPIADLADVWGAVKARCEQLDCQVENSALQRETPHSAGRAFLSMRVNPRDFAALSAALGGNAKVLNHQTSSEDKTDEVIDVEAQIKNRSDYRDSLRELLREKDIKRRLTDLIEIRDKLSEVQGEIDAANGRRKVLERETAKQFVQMTFEPEQVASSQVYSPWMQTWQEAGRGLISSAQSMVLFAAALLPWALVLGVLALIVIPLVRRVRRARKLRVAQLAETVPVESTSDKPSA